MQTQIRLLLKEQSDQGLHYLSFHLPLLDALLHPKNQPFACQDNLLLTQCLDILLYQAVELWVLGFKTKVDSKVRDKDFKCKIILTVKSYSFCIFKLCDFKGRFLS